MSFDIRVESQHDMVAKFMQYARVLDDISPAAARELAGRLVHEEVVTELLPAYDTLLVLTAQIGSYDEAAGQKIPVELRTDALAKLIEVADGIVDSVYVLMHMSNTFNLPFDAMFAEVHRSNMSKLLLNKETKEVYAEKREDGKIMKPASYSPPNLKDIIGKHFEQINAWQAQAAANAKAKEVTAFNAKVAERRIKNPTGTVPESATPAPQTPEHPHQ